MNKRCTIVIHNAVVPRVGALIYRPSCTLLADAASQYSTAKASCNIPAAKCSSSLDFPVPASQVYSYCSLPMIASPRCGTFKFPHFQFNFAPSFAEEYDVIRFRFRFQFMEII